MIRIERSSNYYRFLYRTYSLFIVFRKKTYRVSLLHVKLPFREIQNALYESYRENAALRAKIKALEKEL